MKRGQQPRQPTRREKLYGLLKRWGAEIESSETMSGAGQLQDWAYGACVYALQLGVISDDEEREIEKTIDGAYRQAAKRIAAQRAERWAP